MLSPLYDAPEDNEPKKEDLEEGITDFGDEELDLADTTDADIADDE